MFTDSRAFFREYFSKLSAGVDPYPWQEAVFDRIISGQWPETISAPTGSGKTALIVIWALAFAWSRLRPDLGISVPRRLVWVVNNRVVVDQSTYEAEKLRDALVSLAADDPVKAAFADASVSRESLLAISTLRGQFEDNQEWKRDPTRPAIIIGTVDLLGSNLLFRGYREGRYWRPSNAGILGVDTLIVNDEAHLTPAFERLLRGINGMNPAEEIPGKTFRVIYLSATARGGARFEHSFDEDIAQSEHFHEIFTAPKHLRIERVADRSIESEIYSAAIAQPQVPRTLVFIDKPEDALRMADRIGKSFGSDRVRLLTGTMRGYERDRLAKSDVFISFMQSNAPEVPCWIVCTAAGEVGVNLTSERLVTGLVSGERLLQRFGRLNRFGNNVPGEAVLVVGTPASSEQKKTLEFLAELPVASDKIDVSCQALAASKLPEDAMSPAPMMARLEPRLVEIWAQTCYRDSVLPRVEKWLHGKQEDDAETEIAWRDDVGNFGGEVDPEQVREAYEKYRVLPHERLREPSYRVAEKLKRIPGEQSEQPVVAIDTDGEASISTLGELVQKLEDGFGAIAYRLLILPRGCGAPVRGMFQPVGEAEQWDVADEIETRTRMRLVIRDVGGERIGSNDGEIIADDLLVRDRQALAKFAEREGYGKPVVVEIGSGQEEQTAEWLVYFPARNIAKGRVRYEVELQPHLGRVRDWAGGLAEALGLNAFLHDFRVAGERHDIGKRDEVWKRAMGVPAGCDLAKTAGRSAPRLLGGFRHEFKSLLEADDASELARHFIATHHGYGRPFFECSQYARDGLRRSEAAALEAANRFARLQARFGAWGLAYLEAVFKAADGLASAEEEKEAAANA